MGQVKHLYQVVADPRPYSNGDQCDDHAMGAALGIQGRADWSLKRLTAMLVTVLGADAARTFMAALKTRPRSDRRSAINSEIERGLHPRCDERHVADMVTPATSGVAYPKPQRWRPSHRLTER